MEHRIAVTFEKHALSNFAVKRHIQKCILAALKAQGVNVPCEINVFVCGDETIRAINQSSRKIDKATDVLSFPMFELTPGRGGAPAARRLDLPLEEALASALGVERVTLLRCGGGDQIAAQREQWNDGSNTLCIAPGRVITYERNYVTNDLLAKHGLDVLTVPSAELSRGRGGPRCMSCPVNRDDL